MAGSLSGSIALITGGAKRIGRATAIALADAGANIIVHYRSSSSDAEELVRQAKGLGVEAWAVQADLGSGEDLKTLIDTAHEFSGGFDILINNASVFPQSEFDTFELEDLHENIKLNAWAPLELAREFADKERKGHIISFLDTKVSGYDWAHVAYHASKKMLSHFTRMMAIRFAPHIAVNAVAPGLILPPEGKGPDYLEGLKHTVPLQRVGGVKDITDAVMFLLTSRFITGQTIFVDGGRHLKEADFE